MVEAVEEEDFVAAVVVMEEAEVALKGSDSLMKKEAIRVLFNVTVVVDMGILKQIVGSKIRR